MLEISRWIYSRFSWKNTWRLNNSLKLVSCGTWVTGVATGTVIASWGATTTCVGCVVGLFSSRIRRAFRLSNHRLALAFACAIYYLFFVRSVSVYLIFLDVVVDIDLKRSWVSWILWITPTLGTQIYVRANLLVTNIVGIQTWIIVHTNQHETRLNYRPNPINRVHSWNVYVNRNQSSSV